MLQTSWCNRDKRGRCRQNQEIPFYPLLSVFVFFEHRLHGFIRLKSGDKYLESRYRQNQEIRFICVIRVRCFYEHKLRIRGLESDDEFHENWSLAIGDVATKQ